MYERYERIVKSLRSCMRLEEPAFECIEMDGGCCDSIGRCIPHLMDDTANAIEELARRNEQFMYTPLPAWIPVTERLPDIGEEVLCNCRARILFVLAWDGTHWHEGTDRYYMGSFVTHWMPLPEPPKGEDNEHPN